MILTDLRHSEPSKNTDKRLFHFTNIAPRFQKEILFATATKWPKTNEQPPFIPSLNLALWTYGRTPLLK